MLNIIKNFKAFISKEVIKNFEIKYNIIIPNDYIEFLLKYNWGLLEKRYFNINIEQWDDIISLLYWLNIDETYINIFDEICNYSQYNIDYNFRLNQERFPKWYITIACDNFWNEICISMNNRNLDYWKVYFWDHENENPYEWEDPWMENMYLVANSFTEFIENIKADEN